VYKGSYCFGHIGKVAALLKSDIIIIIIIIIDMVVYPKLTIRNWQKQLN